MDIIEKIKQEAKRQNLSVRKLAEASNVGNSTVHNLGLNTALENILKIINGLKKTPCDFFCENNDETNLISESISGYNLKPNKYIKLLEENRDLRKPILRGFICNTLQKITKRCDLEGICFL